MSQSTSVLTNLSPGDAATETGRLQFMVRAALSGLRTAVPVQVVSVTNSGGVSPIGTVSVQPLVSAVDGSGKVWPHGIIYNVPYMRIQGGANAVIIDPQVGDIGLAVVCDRDISTVKASGGVSAPGSTRKNDLSDLVYLMTIIGGTPTQYLQFNAAGITITSPATVNVNAQAVNVNATTATVTASGTATIKAASIVLQNAGAALKSLVNSAFVTLFNNHVHGNGNAGANTTAPTTAAGSGQLTSTVQAE